MLEQVGGGVGRGRTREEDLGTPRSEMVYEERGRGGSSGGRRLRGNIDSHSGVTQEAEL